MGKQSIQTSKLVAQLRDQKQPIIDKCSNEKGVCSRAFGNYCRVYYMPTAAWRRGDCLMADNFLKLNVQEVEKEKKRVGQQKQKKKGKK